MNNLGWEPRLNTELRKKATSDFEKELFQAY